MIKKILPALVLAGAFASAQATTLLTEGFEHVNTLTANGWVMNNLHAGPTLNPTWFQPTTAMLDTEHLFDAHSGTRTSYAVAEYGNGALADGTEAGVQNNWLITPTFSTENAVTISLWIRGDADANTAFFDQVLYNFSSGGSAIADFHVVGSDSHVQTDAWHQFSVTIGAQGAGTVGRFAIQYTGNVVNSNYIGIDDLLIETAAAPDPDPDPNPNNVPEPATMLLLATGLMGLAATRRRRH